MLYKSSIRNWVIFHSGPARERPGGQAPAPLGPAGRHLLQVALDLVQRAGLRAGRVLAVLTAGPALAGQAPPLVQGLLDGAHLSALLVSGKIAGRQLAAQVMLGGDELVNMREDLLVIHGPSLWRTVLDQRGRAGAPRGRRRPGPVLRCLLVPRAARSGPPARTPRSLARSGRHSAPRSR